MSGTVGSHAWQLTFNETGGFSADSSSLVFTSDFETHNFWSNQIYRHDLNSGATTRLTRGNSYDSSFYGDVETNLLTSDSVIVRAELTCHGW